MNQKEQFIDFLRHYRHDWLNHIQIIKGYISMDKKDELRHFLDQVVVKSHYETQVSQLGNAELAYFLLTYNWIQDKIILEVEIESDIDEISVIGKRYSYIQRWISEITKMFEAGATSEDENRLLLLFEYKNNQLTLCVDYFGGWRTEIGERSLKKLNELVRNDQGKLTIKIHNQNELSFDIIAES